MLTDLTEEISAIILIGNIWFSAFLTGLIWVIQLVHYPLFLRIDKKDFRNYEKSHQRKISMIVAPVMIVDIILSLLLLLTPFFPAYPVYTLLAFMLNLIVFGSTIFVFAPIHRILGNGYNPVLIRKLVKLNMMRTALWTTRSLVLIILTLEIFSK